SSLNGCETLHAGQSLNIPTKINSGLGGVARHFYDNAVIRHVPFRIAKDWAPFEEFLRTSFSSSVANPFQGSPKPRWPKPKPKAGVSQDWLLKQFVEERLNSSRRSSVGHCVIGYACL